MIQNEFVLISNRNDADKQIDNSTGFRFQRLASFEKLSSNPVQYSVYKVVEKLETGRSNVGINFIIVTKVLINFVSENS